MFSFLLSFYCSFSFLEWYVHKNHNTDKHINNIVAMWLCLMLWTTGLNWVFADPWTYKNVWILTTSTFWSASNTFSQRCRLFRGGYAQVFPGVDCIMGSNWSIEKLNEKCWNGIGMADVSAVKECLLLGADPNCKDMSYVHPTTPLELVVFRISDVFVTEQDMENFLDITRLLLKYGANPNSAADYAISRYPQCGNRDSKTPTETETENLTMKKMYFNNIIKLIVDRTAL